MVIGRGGVSKFFAYFYFIIGGPSKRCRKGWGSPKYFRNCVVNSVAALF